MLLPTFLTTTALALTANAFLVPLEVADSAKAAASAIAAGVLPSSQTINLDCSSCPFALAGAENEPHTWSTSPPKTDLVMKFDTTADKKQVTLNGVAFFPPTFITMQHMLAAHQVIQDGEVLAADVKPYSQELGLSYSIDASEDVVQDDVTLQPITFTILGLDGKVVNVDTISIPIIKAANGDVSAVLSSSPLQTLINSCSYPLRKSKPHLSILVPELLLALQSCAAFVPSLSPRWLPLVPLPSRLFLRSPQPRLAACENSASKSPPLNAVRIFTVVPTNSVANSLVKMAATMGPTDTSRDTVWALCYTLSSAYSSTFYSRY